MKPELLALGTKVQLTGILSPRYGYINSYSASSDHPYLIKTDDGLEVLCNDNDINVVSYIVDRNDVPTKEPKFEKEQIVFYEPDYYTRQVVVVNEVDREDGDYHISYMDGTDESVWADENELSEINETSDCVASAVTQYRELGDALIIVSEEIERLEKLLSRRRSQRGSLQFAVEVAEQDVLKNAREVGSMD